MNKTLTTLVAAATLAGSLAATATTASAQGRGFLPGLIVGGIVGGAIVGATQPRGYVVYPGYNAPLNGPGCYWTRQPVYDPYGNVVKRASHDAEEMVIVPCDLGLIDVARTHWPFLRDRRIDAYGGLTKRYLDEGK